MWLSDCGSQTVTLATLLGAKPGDTAHFQLTWMPDRAARVRDLGLQAGSRIRLVVVPDITILVKTLTAKTIPININRSATIFQVGAVAGRAYLPLIFFSRPALTSMVAGACR